MAIFSPGRQNDEEIRASYIARQAMLDLILQDIHATRPGAIPQHHIIIGQRGMGKTTLLKRLDVALRDEPLTEHFIPLGFPEEQYAVDRLSTVFLNCLDSLADTLEREEHSQDLIDRIDDEVERLRKDRASDDLVAQDAERTLLALAAETGRRPVLLVDNLDLIFDRLKKHELYHLRAFLMKAGAPILIGSAVHPPEETQNYDSPFYDHFKPHHLSRLSLEEMREVLLKLAELAGNTEIPARIDLERGRLHALHALTGGNPRTTRILFEIFANGFSQEAYQDLEALLDWMTPIYKARFEELSDQAQVVVSAIATIWEPAVLSRICEETRLLANQISPQLDRLKKSGVIEEVTVDPPDRVGPIPPQRTPKDRTGYQLTERFFNIWFLMRQATRRDKRNLTFLTRFIECLHTPEERLGMAKDLLSKQGLSRADQVYGLALEPTLPNSSLRADLRDHVYEAIVQAKREFNEHIEEIIDPTEIPQRQWDIAELRERLAVNAPGSSPKEKRSYAEEILACPMLVEQRTSLASTQPSAKQSSALIKRVRSFRKNAVKAWGEADWKWFEKLLTTGALISLRDSEMMSEAILRGDSMNRCLMLISIARVTALRQISKAAFEHLSLLLAPRPKDRNADHWVRWGLLLHRELGKHVEALKAYQKALKINPKDSHTWNYIGLIHFYDTKLPAKAREAFEQAIDADATNHHAWHNLANTFCQHLNMPLEAVGHYQKAISLQPEFWLAWGGLGWVLTGSLKRHDEAIAAFRKAIEINPHDFQSWNNLASVFHHHTVDFKLAEEYYRKALAEYPRYDVALRNLGDLLVLKKEFREAGKVLSEATLTTPNDPHTWKSYGNLLRDHLHDYAEAEKAYRQALRINPEDSSMWNTLGNLLQDYLSNPSEAREAYQRAIEIAPNDSTCARCNLAFLQANQLNELGEAADSLASVGRASDHAEIADGIELVWSVIAAHRQNWGDAADHLKKALAVLGETKSFPSRTIDDWMRTSAVMIHLNDGRNLVDLLVETGFDQRLRPWTEALKAILRGDKKYLRNAPVEVRESAAELFDEIKIRLDGLPLTSRKWNPAWPARKPPRKQR
jgi:tetratricopeptide (TPR) repeat protein